MFRALANRMAAEPNLQVRFCVNLSPVESGGEAAAVKRFLQAFQRFHWPDDCPLPAFYYDPRTIIPPPALQHRLHARCVVVDSEHAFISSANFTEAAHERNIEVGVLLRSRSTATRLVGFFGHLISAGHLVPIPSVRT